MTFQIYLHRICLRILSGDIDKYKVDLTRDIK